MFWRNRRPSHFIFVVLCLAATYLTAETLPVSAIVVRHDKLDADTLRLAERFSAVGKVIPDGSCTLITPTWVITAAHVAASLAAGGQIQFGAETHSIKRIVIHPEGGLRAGMPPEVDLALLELETAVKQIVPVTLYRDRTEIGKQVIIVGYGDYGSPKGKLKRSDGKRRAVTNVVDDAGPRRIFMKFDEPPAGTNLEGVGGPGDSGGPALIELNGRVLLAGVSSGSMNGKPGEYGITDVYTRVSSYIQWIEKTINAQ